MAIMNASMRTTKTTEYAVYKMRSPYTKHEAYLVERDGVKLDVAETPEQARKIANADARSNLDATAGLTELFGRNRQFVLGPRGGWKKYVVVSAGGVEERVAR